MMTQDEALKKIGQHEVVKRHDDGDLTIKDAAGCLHVVTTEGETFTEQSCACAEAFSKLKLPCPAPAATEPQKREANPKLVRRLLDASQVSDFDVRTDKVVRRGDHTYLVDTSGLKADMQLSSDAITPEIKTNLEKLTPEQKGKMAVVIQNTPYLSPEGKAERLAVLRGRGNA